jgi:hypothetical protein
VSEAVKEYNPNRTTALVLASALLALSVLTAEAITRFEPQIAHGLHEVLEHGEGEPSARRRQESNLLQVSLRPASNRLVTHGPLLQSGEHAIRTRNGVTRTSIPARPLTNSVTLQKPEISPVDVKRKVRDSNPQRVTPPLLSKQLPDRSGTFPVPVVKPVLTPITQILTPIVTIGTG